MANTKQVDSQNVGRSMSGEWLVDNNVSYHLDLIIYLNASDPKYPKIHAFNTFFYAKIDVGGRKAVKHWTERVRIFRTPTPLSMDDHDNTIHNTGNVLDAEEGYFDDHNYNNYANEWPNDLGRLDGMGCYLYIQQVSGPGGSWTFG
jgi:hypothetical protein